MAARSDMLIELFDEARSVNASRQSYLSLGRTPRPEAVFSDAP